MPTLSIHQTALRADGHVVEFYVGFFLGATVLTGTVSATPANGATAINYTLSTGASANVKRGFRVVIKSSDGAFKGATRVRNSGTISATSIPVRELAWGSIKVAAGDTIEVLNIIQPGDKLVEADANFRPDGEVYSNQNSAIPPRANAGPHDIGFVDAGQAYRTVQFFGSLSETDDNDSAGTITHAWSAPTATGATSSTDADPAFTFPVGEHVVTYTATDSSNGAVGTTYRSVRVYDDSVPPYDCALESLDSDIDSGTSARFRLFADAGLDTLYDGAMGAVFVREWLNGVEQSFGSDSSGRSHIKAIGYLRRDEASFSGEDGVQSLSFELISPLVFYREVLGYSKVGTNAVSPDDWSEIDDLSVWRMLAQIAKRYTWITEQWDFIRHSTFSDKLYSQFFLTKQNPVAQMLELADGVDARITCTREGRFEVQTDPNYIALASRAAVTTALTIDENDYAEFDLAREHWRPVEIIEGRGFTAGLTGNQPIFSRWPGLAPGEGTLNENIERLIASSQPDLNNRMGPRGAFRDGILTDANGVMERAVEGTIRLPGSYLVFDPARLEYLVADIDGSYNLRGIDLNNHRLVIRRVTYEPDELGHGGTTLDVRTATHGAAGTTYVPPQEESNGLPPYTPPSFSFPPFDFTTPDFATPYLPRGTGTIALWLNNHSLAITTDFGTTAAAGGPLWTVYDLSASVSGSATQGLSAVVDAFSPGYIGTGTSVNIWVVTSTGLYYIEDIFNARTVTLKHTFANATTLRTIHSERGFPNVVCVNSNYEASGHKLLWATDNSTFTETTVTANAVSGSYPTIPYLHVSGRIFGQVYAGAFGPSGLWRLYSGNFGGGPPSFSDISPAASINGTFGNGVYPIHVPFMASTDDSVWYNGVSTGTAVGRLIRHDASGDTNVSHGSIYWNTSTSSLRGFSVCEVDLNSLLMCGSITGALQGLYLSRDKGASWSTIDSSATYIGCHIAGDSADIAYAWGANGAIAYITLSGAVGTVDSRIGNLSTSATVHNIFGG